MGVRFGLVAILVFLSLSALGRADDNDNDYDKSAVNFILSPQPDSAKFFKEYLVYVIRTGDFRSALGGDWRWPLVNLSREASFSPALSEEQLQDFRACVLRKIFDGRIHLKAIQAIRNFDIEATGPVDCAIPDKAKSDLFISKTWKARIQAHDDPSISLSVKVDEESYHLNTFGGGLRTGHSKRFTVESVACK